MYRFNQSLIAFGGATVVILLGHSAGYAQQGFPQQAGPPPQNVTVINTPSEPVPVTGSILVRDVDNPAQQPVLRFFFRAGSVLEEPYTVPDGKRLVIEHISGEVTSDATCKALYGVLFTTVANGGSIIGATHRFPLSTTPLPLRTVFSEQVRTYADPNTSVQAGANGHDGAGNCRLPGFSVVISGYLVDVPPTPTP